VSDKPWRELEAGRELDCIVAEALGWKNIEQYRDGEWLGDDPADDYGLQPVPFYSVNANAALLLLTDLPEDIDFDLSVSRVADLNFKDAKWLALRGKLYYTASFYTGENEDRVTMSFGEADTAALAICRALLAYRERMK
jgi:hypothetical protein